jgi:hypothetical protein
MQPFRPRSSRPARGSKSAIPYSAEAFRQDIHRAQSASDKCQANGIGMRSMGIDLPANDTGFGDCGSLGSKVQHLNVQKSCGAGRS